MHSWSWNFSRPTLQDRDQDQDYKYQDQDQDQDQGQDLASQDQDRIKLDSSALETETAVSRTTSLHLLYCNSGVVQNQQVYYIPLSLTRLVIFRDHSHHNDATGFVESA